MHLLFSKCCLMATSLLLQRYYARWGTNCHTLHKPTVPHFILSIFSYPPVSSDDYLACPSTLDGLLDTFDSLLESGLLTLLDQPRGFYHRHAQILSSSLSITSRLLGSDGSKQWRPKSLKGKQVTGRKCLLWISREISTHICLKQGCS